MGGDSRTRGYQEVRKGPSIIAHPGARERTSMEVGEEGGRTLTSIMLRAPRGRSFDKSSPWRQASIV